uniref:4-hydroxy-tetrahydrodipicolinate synthase n=1 Tax=Tetraselmis sp. GSL018 TaxID=582737 RepID=A0A061SLQ7_9CHLO|mmetsp:Transcript_33298/g.78968  ORF Transcript_33298/g.78968 Transcript_33298/m.78968 type:complete len:362 (-) Transcript_33298:66-1151(-)|eukprot:CAMPEP_0177582686 /NCGR_PEP_ID=MMETSP0419_2-20121207/2894_1 /TAXON_ID=582737 /ORGANISM="Tetraselmis sp., Strain GSL018" /LENGTH=361 /DNA_ID=CAMNT_0019071973 /DNA_START=37 /DNA_END=1122 /DNA_ORIENTATION=-
MAYICSPARSLAAQVGSAQLSEGGIKPVRRTNGILGPRRNRCGHAVSASMTQEPAGTHCAGKARTYVAAKTPFLENGHFDLGAYEEHLARMVQHGVEGVIVGGTTGEGHLMSWDEHLMLIAWTARNFGDKLKVIGNTGSNSTREAVHATEQGFAVGMHAALQINPYYGKTSKEGLVKHFEAVLDEGPGMVYNVPGRTGQDIPDDVIIGLSKHPNFLGVKECTGNSRILSYAERGIKCWSGNDDECHEGRHKYRGFGVVSVAANLMPGAWARLMGPEPDYELMARLDPLTRWLFHEPNPIAINTAMAMCGLCKPVFRAPYVPCSREAREEGARLMNEVIEFIPGVEEVRPLEDEDFSVVTNF